MCEYMLDRAVILAAGAAQQHHSEDNFHRQQALPCNITPAQISLVNQTAGSLGRYLLLSDPGTQITPHGSGAGALTEGGAEMAGAGTTAAVAAAAVRSSEQEAATPQPLGSSPPPTVLLRFVLVVFAIWMWESGTERLMSLSGPVQLFEAVDIADFGFGATAPLRAAVTSKGALQVMHHQGFNYEPKPLAHIKSGRGFLRPGPGTGAQ